jgi:hypothetical protein
MMVALSHLLPPGKHFPGLSLLTAILHFLRKKKKKEKKRREEKRTSPGHICIHSFVY